MVAVSTKCPPLYDIVIVYRIVNIVVSCQFTSPGVEDPEANNVLATPITLDLYICVKETLMNR